MTDTTTTHSRTEYVLIYEDEHGRKSVIEVEADPEYMKATLLGERKYEDVIGGRHYVIPRTITTTTVTSSTEMDW